MGLVECLPQSKPLPGPVSKLSQKYSSHFEKLTGVLNNVENLELIRHFSNSQVGGHITVLQFFLESRETR